MAKAADEVRVYPAPQGEAMSEDFKLTVDDQEAPVYAVKVAPADPTRRWKAMDDKPNSHTYFELASMASFDFRGHVKLTVTCKEPVQSVRVLPSSYKLKAGVRGNRLTITLDEPRQLTIEVNGRWVNALHIFANPLESDPPRPNDPNVIYYGPGVHQVESVKVPSGKTVYLAGGAILRGTPPKGKWGNAVLSLEGDNIVVRGRGIIDGSLCPTHSRNLLAVRGANIVVEGVTLLNSSVWTMPIRSSQHVKVSNVKLIGYRANSDGIDICNSSDVLVSGCFLRTLDDLVVIKTPEPKKPSSQIVVKECVLWNEVAHALSLGAEMRSDVSDVLFSDCDVIHDKGREWTLRVFQCDAATISNVRWENIRIEESPRLMSLWIGKSIWTHDAERGHIENILFKNIVATSQKPLIQFVGFDAQHLVQDVYLRHVVVNGQPLKPDGVKANEFVRGVRVLRQ